MLAFWVLSLGGTLLIYNTTFYEYCVHVPVGIHNIIYSTKRRKKERAPTKSQIRAPLFCPVGDLSTRSPTFILKQQVKKERGKRAQSTRTKETESMKNE